MTMTAPITTPHKKGTRTNAEYAALVHGFPPRPIHSEKQYDATVEVMNKLAVRDENTLSPAEIDYLDALALFVELYDREHHPIPEDKRTPLDRLKYLMEESDMKTADLGRLLGNQSLASKIMLGKRQLSKTHIRKLADHFDLMADYFL
ncbi:MAG: hypothetical protein FWD61_18655 [Phycisphaerales bacterium]|nr:hypothetical protein [Phycisphaerales bacterium]